MVDSLYLFIQNSLVIWLKSRFDSNLKVFNLFLKGVWLIYYNKNFKIHLQQKVKSDSLVTI